MNVLAVDTSSTSGSIALRSDTAVVGEIRLTQTLQRSDGLFRSIDFILEQTGMTLADIDLFAAARGPGSFTGLRVGLAAIEGLAFAQQSPSVGISTLAGWAWMARRPNSLISPVLDARRGEIYAALYGSDGEELIELRPPAVLKPAQWLSQLPHGSIIFCGTGLALVGPGLGDHPDRQRVSVGPYLADAIAEMALTNNKEPLEPLYIRGSDAEVNRSSDG